MAKRHGSPYHDLVDGLGPHLAELLGVLATLAVTVLTEGAYVHEHVPLAKHSQ